MRILVTGGAGMLGRAVTQVLKQSGHAVKCFDLHPSPEPGIESIIGDIRHPDDVTRACTGMDALIHTAVMVNQNTAKQPAMYDVNVTGTLNVIAGCRAAQVPRLVYISSIDVVFDGTPIRDGDERLPYPKRHLDYYSETKTLAEQAVIAANGSGLATCSIRAGGLYGEHDQHRFPNVIPRVVTTGTFTRIGDGSAVHNHVYVGNTAYALKLAVERLSAESPLAGQCYFITDHAPGNFFDFFVPFLRALNVPYKEAHLSEAAALLVAQAAQRTAFLTRGKLPPITRYAVLATTRDFSFVSHKAARDFGYAPIYSQQDAFERTLAWTRETLVEPLTNH